MTKWYKIFSLAYRIILGLFIVAFLILSSLFSEVNQDKDNFGFWALVFSIITLIAITTFHRLKNNSNYKIVVQGVVCILVTISLAFMLFLLLTGEDGNLLIHSVFLITIIVNAGSLFYLVQDKKYNQNS